MSPDSHPPGPAKRSRGLPRRIIAGAALLLVGFAVGASLVVLLAPAATVGPSATYATVAAREGNLRRSITLNASIAWEQGVTARLAGGGVLTAISLAGRGPVHSGEILATVGLRPVTAAQGLVPMWRDLSRSARGPDVQQLQNMLVSLGRLPASSADGDFGTATREAVLDWQRAAGLPGDGIVRASDLIFFPELPSRLALIEGISLGDRLADGAEFIRVLKAPRAQIALPEGQLSLIREGQRVALALEGRRWETVIGPIVNRPDAQGPHYSATLGVSAAEPFCGDACAEVAVGPEALVPADIEVVPPTSGVIVPASAITLDASGASAVVLSDGSMGRIAVLASVGSEVVVSGIEAGTLVRAPALSPRSGAT